MADYEKKEKFEGTWRGANVSFNRTFRGKRLTDAECEALCRDEDVTIRGLVGKTGNTYGVIGHLDHMEYNGYQYVGVRQVDWAPRDPNEKRGIPAKLCGHEFTPEEKAALQAGNILHAEGLVSAKTGKTFAADLRYDEAQDKIIFDFGK